MIVIYKSNYQKTALTGWNWSRIFSPRLQQRKFYMKIYIEGYCGREEGGSPSPMFNVGSPMVR